MKFSEISNEVIQQQQDDSDLLKRMDRLEKKVDQILTGMNRIISGITQGVSQMGRDISKINSDAIKKRDNILEQIKDNKNNFYTRELRNDPTAGGKFPR